MSRFVGRRRELDEEEAPKVLQVLSEGGEEWTIHYALFARAGFTEAAQAHRATLVDLAALDRDLKAAARVLWATMQVQARALWAGCCTRSWQAANLHLDETVNGLDPWPSLSLIILFVQDLPHFDQPIWPITDWRAVPKSSPAG